MWHFADSNAKSFPVIMSSPLNGGAGFAGTSGRKTANVGDENASEMSAHTAAQFILKSNFTKCSNTSV
jgi:hypothetical protein